MKESSKLWRAFEGADGLADVRAQRERKVV